MSEPRTVTVERDFAYPVEKLWRALTQPHLIAEWLMNNDFVPQPGHAFKFTADWGAVDCQVKVVEVNRTLAYSWSAYGLDTLVTWTLTPTDGGTHVRMDQSGFGPDHNQAFMGAQMGWKNFFAQLEDVMAKA